MKRSVPLYTQAVEEKHDLYLADVSKLILREHTSGLIDISIMIKLYEKTLVTDCERDVVSLSYVLLNELFSIQNHPNWDKSRAVSSLARGARNGDSDVKQYIASLRINME